MYLVFDIGATNARVALVKRNRLIKPQFFRTPESLGEVLSLLSDYAAGQSFSAVAGCLPGQFNLSKRRLTFARNLPNFRGLDIAGAFEKTFHCPVFMENDAALAGLGEAVYGAGKGRDIVVYFTISSGVNGVRIVDGKIDRKAWGFEIGGQLLDKTRDLESLVGGKALSRRYKIPPEKIANSKIWRQVSADLARGVFNSLVFWSPDIVVLGGGLIDSGAVRLIQTNTELRRIKITLKTPVPLPPVVVSKLGRLAGLYGALEYLKQQKK